MNIRDLLLHNHSSTSAAAAAAAAAATSSTTALNLSQLKKELLALQHHYPILQGNNRAAFEELMKKKFFYSNSFSIYGGMSGLFDYGPSGCALLNNIVDYWRRWFVLEEEMLEMDTTVLTPYEVLKTSGHVDRFSDLMCKDLMNGEIYRVDHLVESELGKKLLEETVEEEEKKEIQLLLNKIDGLTKQELSNVIKKFGILSPAGNPLSEPEVFNLMFSTSIGPHSQVQGFLRPETAQGQFVNFKKLLEFNNDKMPFASATIGKSFRNEISPRQGLLRVREFLMAEIEHYVDPKGGKKHEKFDSVQGCLLQLLSAKTQQEGKAEVELITARDAVDRGIVNNETLAYFMVRIQQFLLEIGIKPQFLRFRQHMHTEMAHYACDCWDAELKSSYGWVECVGCADRSAYDLTRHTERTGERLVARETLKEPQTKEVVKLQLEKKVLGPAFKKDAKLVEELLVKMEEKELLRMDEKLKSEGKYELKSGEKIFEITPKMVQVEKVQETVHVVEYVPNVIEPSFGLGRILYCLLEHSFYLREGSETRNVLQFPPVIAPIKVLIVPIIVNPDFDAIMKQVSKKLRASGVSLRTDTSGNKIGKKYSRMDELGTPFAITVDFESLKDNCVTLRERDSTKQIRADVDTVVKLVKEMCEGMKRWEEVEKQYPTFVKESDE